MSKNEHPLLNRFSFYPILYLNTLHILEIFHIFRDHNHVIDHRSASYQQIEVVVHACTCKLQPAFFLYKHVDGRADWKNCKVRQHLSGCDGKLIALLLEDDFTHFQLNYGYFRHITIIQTDVMLIQIGFDVEVPSLMMYQNVGVEQLFSSNSL